MTRETEYERAVGDEFLFYFIFSSVSSRGVKL